MLIQPGKVMTWLYTSEFTVPKSHDEIIALVDTFIAKNKKMDATGFLISNGTAVMQLLEGDRDVLVAIKDKVLKDDRHTNIVSEVWELEPKRAYPHWSMQVVDPKNYNGLFGMIESAKIATISTNIARLLFDTTFDGP